MASTTQPSTNQIEPTKHKIMIVGSCVSRDAFEFAESNDFEITSYCARSSLASAFAAPYPISNDIKVASIWQTKMLQLDAQKNLRNTIESSDWDILVVDLIDERFDIARNGPIVVTSSMAFSEAGLREQVLADDFHILNVFSEERFKLWCSAWDQLYTIAQSSNQDGIIVVNKAGWAKDNIALDLYNADYIDKQNAALDKMFSYIEQYQSVKFIDYASNSLSIDPNHKWGAAPFHYTQPLYNHFLESLRYIKSTSDNK